jgi:tetratricopeptide (TPR) repeat protein
MSETTDTNFNDSPKASKAPKTISRWIPILGFIILIVLGISAGIGSGVIQRNHAEATVVTRQVDEQFRLGIEAMNTGQYEVAFQHFDFVARHDQKYTGLEEALTQLALWMSMSPTPSPTLTPTITPTPDLRGAEAIYNQAKEYISAKDWTNALNSLDALRKTDPAYRAVNVDGMYYIALRSRGWAKLFPQNCVDTNLEGGIYDLTLAERFGPLDGEANGARTFARYYLAGSAFWEVNWVKAQNYFAQSMLGYPNMMDSSCKTAQDHWREATIEYAKQLLAEGKECEAAEQFSAAFNIYSNDNLQYYATATAVYYVCNPVRPTAVPSIVPTSGGDTPTVEVPTATP